MSESSGFCVCAEEFREVLKPDSRVARLATGLSFTEGPVWVPAEQCLLFSDIPADRLYRWSAGEGLRVWREPSGHANGNTLDREGRLLTCEHGTRRLTRTEPDGTVTVLAERFRGRRLNSPNDVVVKSDGSIWFTDPPYGIRPEEQEQDGNFVFRLEPETGELAVVAEDFDRPNGLCFSPDEGVLYVADSSARRHIRRFAVGERGELSGGEVFAEIEPGVPDGMRVDAAGRLYSTAGDGVQVYSPNGELLGKILTPEVAANCAFGGEDGSTLFLTATHSLYAVELAVRGGTSAS